MSVPIKQTGSGMSHAHQASERLEDALMLFSIVCRNYFYDKAFDIRVYYPFSSVKVTRICGPCAC